MFVGSVCGMVGRKIRNTLYAKYIIRGHMALSAWIWSSSGIGNWNKLHYHSINRHRASSSAATDHRTTPSIFP